MSKENTKKLYKQGYRQSWESNPILKDWIQAVPDKPDKAYCRYCKRTLYAHRYSVLKHTCTIKHQQNVDKFKLRPPSEEILAAPATASIKEESKYCKEDIVANASEYISQAIINGEEEHPNEEYSQIDQLDEPCNQVIITSEEYLEITDSNKEDSGNELQESIDGHFHITEEQSHYQYESDLETSSQNEAEMSHTKKTISTHILDTTRGQPATNVPVVLFKLDGHGWKEINRFVTDNDGRISELISAEQFGAGCYKLHFDVSGYLKDTAGKYLYPFIEIAFHCEEGEHYHIPLLLNPFGYSTYRGS